MTDPTFIPTMIVLEEGETVTDYKRRQRLVDDCRSVADVIHRHPGIESKRAIADATGLTPVRVHRCIRYINANETPFSRIDYGVNTARDGRHAGETRTGWWPMRYAAYAPVMDQADEHSRRTEIGVHRSRMIRLGFARGLNTAAAAQVVATIEARLGVDVEALSASDLDAFEELLVEELNGAA